MEERKLNFNAPLLSVRRFSAALASSKGEKDNKNGKSVLHKRNSLPVYRSDARLEQVTEPVTVPFTWEHIPGKAKSESKRSEEASVIPRLPPGRHLDVVKCHPLEKECENQDVIRYSPVETCSGRNEELGLNTENEDDDAYSDALDTLSQTDSLSLNCSVSGISGSGALVSKPSGTVSTDQQTRNFMMSRFLPAAKAMAMESPQYAIKMQPRDQPVENQPRESNQIVAFAGNRKPPVNIYESMIVPHYDRGQDEEETESQDNDYNAPSKLSRKGCGFFPRLCFKNSLFLLNPIPILKVRNHSSTTSLAQVGKPSKPASMEKARNASYKQKSGSAAQSPKVTKIGSKLSSASSKFTYSGELYRKLDYGAQSPKVNKIGSASSKFTYSGELYRRLDYGAQSPKPPVIGRKPSSVSNHFPNSTEQQLKSDSGAKSPKLPDSSEQQISRSSSPYRSSGGGRISPYRRERPQSPFRGGGFLGLPKEAENLKPNMMIMHHDKVGSKSQELPSPQSFRRGAGSARPVVEKTLYVDTEKFSESSSVRPNLSGRKGKTGYVSRSGPLLRSRVVGETAAADMNLNHSTEVDFEADSSPATPPLPRKPSESWLRRTLPSVTSQNPFTRTFTGSRFHPKKEETNAASTNAKWETIVKTSYLHHDHVRYSEELVTHVSQQPRT